MMIYSLSSQTSVLFLSFLLKGISVIFLSQFSFHHTPAIVTFRRKPFRCLPGCQVTGHLLFAVHLASDCSSDKGHFTYQYHPYIFNPICWFGLFHCYDVTPQEVTQNTVGHFTDRFGLTHVKNMSAYPAPEFGKRFFDLLESMQ